jgi:hypothetical protein
MAAGAVFFCQLYAGYTLSGVVTDYLTRKPADNCLVRIIGMSPGAITDSTNASTSGAYRFANVPAGAYQIRLDDGKFALDSTLATITHDTTFSFVALARSNILVPRAFPDTLTKAGSPYLVPSTTLPGKPVVIEAGARIVIFNHAYLMFDADVSAIGNEKDSIRFDAGFRPQDTGSVGYVALTKSWGIYRFAYCGFHRLYHIETNVSGLPVRFISFEHCLFDSMYRVLLSMQDLANVKFVGNRAVRCTRGVGGYVMETPFTDTLEMTDNFIQSSMMTLALRPAVAGKYYVRRNTIIGESVIDCSKLSVKDTIVSNIFTDNTFSFAGNNSLFFAYNDHVSTPPLPLGVGTNALVNTKGDSCDFFFNITHNPLIADSLTGTLQKTSPCIGTGMGEENIGVDQTGSTAIKKFGRSVAPEIRKGSFTIISIHRISGGVAVTFRRPAASAANAGTILLYSAAGVLLGKTGFSRSQETVPYEVSVKGAGVCLVSISCGPFRQILRFAVY